jgi:hypothetical protein
MGKDLNLQAIQLGVESTWGTAVAQTTIIDNVLAHPKLIPVNETEFYYFIGTVGAPKYKSLKHAFGRLTIEKLATHQDIIYWLNNLFGTVVPTGSDPYTRTYDAPQNGAATRTPFTILYGDGTDDYSLTGALLSKFTFTLEQKQPAKIKLEFIGKNTTTDSKDSLSSHDTTIIGAGDGGFEVGTVGGMLQQMVCGVRKAELIISAEPKLGSSIGVTTACEVLTPRTTGEFNLLIDGTNSNIKSAFEGTLGTAPSVTSLEFNFGDIAGTNSVARFRFAAGLNGAPEFYADDDGYAVFDSKWMLEEHASFGGSGTWLDAIVINNESGLPA